MTTDEKIEKIHTVVPAMQREVHEVRDKLDGKADKKRYHRILAMLDRESKQHEIEFK